MSLYDLIPTCYASNGKWTIRKDFLMVKKYQNIPVCFIGEDNIIYVFLDNSIKKEILKITQHLVNLGVEFYFTTPELSNPKGVQDYNNKVIQHYLFSYSQMDFYKGFNKIEFDLIKNMVNWTDKVGCSNSIKENYEIILMKVNKTWYNGFHNKKSYLYTQEIRDEFRTLYRDIQINKII